MTNSFTIVDEESLIFHSDKQWEEYDILTKIDGYELDYQDVSSGTITVRKLGWNDDHIIVSIPKCGSSSVFY